MDSTAKKVSSEKPKRILGLDIGISSIGFALLDLEENKILALGSRLFDAGENPDNGSSLAAPRRIKRSMRRRLFRRRQRLSNILKLCQRHGLLEKNSLASHSLTALEKTAGLLGNDPWVLRSEALRRKLSGEELARALYHLAKFRGFKSSLKDKKILEETDSNANQETKETKKMLSGIKDLKAKLAEAQAPTIGDFLLKSFQEKKLSRLHNAPGSYQQTMVQGCCLMSKKLLFSFCNGKNLIFLKNKRFWCYF